MIKYVLCIYRGVIGLSFPSVIADFGGKVVYESLSHVCQIIVLFEAIDQTYNRIE